MAKENVAATAATKKNLVDMAKRRDENGRVRTNDAEKPRSLEVASRGVNTGGQFALLMSSLMSDLIDGKITPSVGNTVCNAGGKLLKVVEMQQRWGTQKNDGTRDLTLTSAAGGK